MAPTIYMYLSPIPNDTSNASLGCFQKSAEFLANARVQTATFDDLRGDCATALGIPSKALATFAPGKMAFCHAVRVIVQKSLTKSFWSQLRAYPRIVGQDAPQKVRLMLTSQRQADAEMTSQGVAISGFSGHFQPIEEQLLHRLIPIRVKSLFSVATISGRSGGRPSRMERLCTSQTSA